MKEEVKSVLQFNHYIVKKVEFDYNLECEENEDGVNIDFDIDADFKVNEDATEMVVFLNMVIFDNPIENNYPFKMKLEMVGIFSMKLGEDEDISFYKSNAVAILFPYARALVSSYTANSNVTPLVLPTININKLLQDKRNREK